MSLPLKVIERLFERLIATYGQEFANKYRGDLNQVKSVWAHELGGYGNKLEAIAYALEHLPERAPNVIEFRNLCQKAPATAELMLDRPKADPAIIALITKKLSIAVPATGRLDWAHAILRRFEGGARISPTVVEMAKTAAGVA